MCILVVMLYGNNCDKVYKKYNIDPDIKSVRGWRRVSKNNKIMYYADINQLDKDNVCNCLSKISIQDKYKQDRSVK